MPRKKKLSPQKLDHSTCSELSWNTSDLMLESDISISQPSASCSLNESFFFEKKRIKTEASDQHIILGSINLPLTSDSFDYNQFDNLYVRFVDEGYSTYEIIIEKYKVIDTGQALTDSLKIIVSDVDICKIIPNLFLHYYHWIIKPREDNTSSLSFDIATLDSKTPIPNAISIIEYFYNKDYSSYSHSSTEHKINLEEFFKHCQNFQKENLNLKQNDVQHEKLLPVLRSYQVDAVNWMLMREQTKSIEEKNEWLTDVYDIFESVDGTTLYFNKYSGILTLCATDVSIIPSGGILADEMGLGKTVEVITCILNNPRNINQENNDDYLIIEEKDLGNTSTTSESLSTSNTTATGKKRRSSTRDSAKGRKRRKTEETDIMDKIYEPMKGPGIRKVLNQWYEQILAGYSTVKTPVKTIASDYDIKCVCGKLTDITDDWKNEGYVQCPECRTFQHSNCVQYTAKFSYFCPPCWTKQKRIKSSGTLIVTPTAICNQWVEEIEKHVVSGSLKVLVYSGAKQGYIQPSELSSYDIVITTYNTLKTELNHTFQNESSRKLRNEEKFLKVTSALTQIEWWRFCLDEAQMVESNISNTNQMAKLIHAVHRWSVTGTPIQKTVNDLYFLIEFLRVEPFSNKSLWKNTMYLPYFAGNKKPLLSLMSHVFWRSAKRDVLDKILLPEQSVIFHPLKFNAIEKHFYMRLHVEQSERFNECIQKSGFAVSRALESLSKTSLSKLLGPLLKLRQACSHPQAVRGVFAHKGKMTHEELLQYLLNKTKVESEEAARKYISSLNGIAGILCICEDWPKAVEFYREVLQFTEEYKNKVVIDSLQLIHTYNNLGEVLEQHSENIPPTLRDSSLRTEAVELENKYLQKITNDLIQSKTALVEFSQKVNNFKSKIRSTSGWWARLLHLLSVENHTEDLLDKITAEITDNSIENKNSSKLFAAKVSSIIGVECTLRNWLDSLENSRKKVMTHLELLNEVSNEFLVERATECHLRTSTTKRLQKCELCSCEIVLLDYECSLFAVAMKKHKLDYEKVLDGAQTKGSWKPHNAEVTLKTILNFGKTKVSESWCLKEGQIHIKLLEALKKEFKQLRVVWREMNHKVQAQDELVMSKLRLRLRMPGEPRPPKKTSNLSLQTTNKLETIHIIEPHEVTFQFCKLMNEIELHKSEFKKKYGTLLYLRNLGDENAKPEPCPICKTTIESEWCVLGCGHSYCLECIQTLCKDPMRTCIKCPVCREATPISDLCFIDISGNEEVNDVSVTGSHPTKIDSLLRTLIKLKQDDPQVKVIIFSTWEKVLDVLDHSMTMNGISFRRMPGYKYQEQLKEFKDPKLKITALLLPIAWGSKGLNLTEATHVFLVEPITNPAEELQAIGRIHRIGQTRPTTVHRFFIKGTIEEKIHSVVSDAGHDYDEGKVTIDDLKNLFITSDPRLQFAS